MNKMGGKMYYLAFLNIEKVYDRVTRNLLCKLLNRIGFSASIVSIIHKMYEDTGNIQAWNREIEWVGRF